MPITGTNESKNTAISASLEEKVGDTIIWNEAEGTWDENEGTWDNPETGAALEQKTTALTASLETKT